MTFVVAVGDPFDGGVTLYGPYDESEQEAVLASLDAGEDAPWTCVPVEPWKELTWDT